MSINNTTKPDQHYWHPTSVNND